MRSFLFCYFVYFYFMSVWSVVGIDIVIQSEVSRKESDDAIKSVFYWFLFFFLRC